LDVFCSVTCVRAQVVSSVLDGTGDTSTDGAVVVDKRVTRARVTGDLTTERTTAGGDGASMMSDEFVAGAC
jgi:hypothetical protein